ncbi:hypothetical protein E1262_23080 [Jiangella aurantiaca]|uniref:Uncharacterized protein n=1 Tax=Jiangella aurantiaca TaxID=2530373 RepID=A0A4R5A2I3_9ACTN|nr:hypothetical protein [Jiangella aurantiaca]TDD66108.1 hypothetical protein E1262_23080 [Jiangella aurantiaca]
MEIRIREARLPDDADGLARVYVSSAEHHLAPASDGDDRSTRTPAAKNGQLSGGRDRSHHQDYPSLNTIAGIVTFQKTS